jgi:hypothetical protein
MKSVTIFLVSLVLGSTAVFAETKQEQYEKYQKMMKETLSQSAENTKKSNIHLNDNIRVTFTDCSGAANNPVVLIMPRENPVALHGKTVILRFSVDSKFAPTNIEVLEGDEETANSTKPSLLRSKFDASQATCWHAKYEYLAPSKPASKT